MLARCTFPSFDHCVLNDKSVAHLGHVAVGKPRRWDIIQAHSSVACVLFHADMDAFLVVRQFRPAVFAHRLREAAAAGLPPPDRSLGQCSHLCLLLPSHACTCAVPATEPSAIALVQQQLYQVLKQVHLPLITMYLDSCVNGAAAAAHLSPLIAVSSPPTAL
jgi:hypothetical protein